MFWAKEAGVEIYFCSHTPHKLYPDFLRWASHCFPIEKAGRQDFMEMISRSIKIIKIGNQCEAHGIINEMVPFMTNMTRPNL